jgi:hypothetical protein
MLFLVIAMAGFIPSYRALYQGVFHVDWIVQVHGAIMTAWLLLFITQAILAEKGRLKFHRQLGMVSIVLGGWILTLYTIALFAMFFTWGILARKRPSIHKRLFFLTTLIILQPAIDRIQWLKFGNSQLLLFIYLDLLLIPLFIYDWVILKRIHKITWLGSLLIIVEQVSYFIISGSPAWHSFWFNLFNKFR